MPPGSQTRALAPLIVSCLRWSSREVQDQKAQMRRAAELHGGGAQRGQRTSGAARLGPPRIRGWLGNFDSDLATLEQAP